MRSVKCSSSLPRCAYYPVRPQLHVVGIIIHGHLEAYYIMDADQPKDSSMNCTIVAQALDKVKEILGPDQALPRNLVIAADNTTRESKNTVFANFVSYLVTKEVFESVEVQFLQANRAQSVMPGKDCAGGEGAESELFTFRFRFPAWTKDPFVFGYVVNAFLGGSWQKDHGRAAEAKIGVHVGRRQWKVGRR